MKRIAATLALAVSTVPPAAGAQSPFLVKDINVEPSAFVSVNARDFVTLDGTTYFSAWTPDTGRELWSSVGGAPAALVSDLNPEGSSHPAGLVPMGGFLYFSAFTPDTGTEIWRTDGTESGTTLVADLKPGPDGSDPAELVPLGSELLFSARAFGLGRELFKTDGSESGTVLVADISPGSSWSAPSELTAFDGYVYLRADEATAGAELWRSDGTAAGTELVVDLAAGPSPSFPTSLRALPSGLYFSAAGPSGNEAYRVADAARLPALVTDLGPGADSSFPADFEEFDGHIYFSAFTPATGREIFRTDGTPAGTELFLDVMPGNLSSSPRSIVAAPDFFAFNALYDAGGAFPVTAYISDGTAGGTFTAGTGVEELTEFLDGIAFSSDEGLFVTGGTPGTTTLAVAGGTIGNEVYFDGFLLWFVWFSATPWTYDGTPGGAQSAGLQIPTTQGSSPAAGVALHDLFLFQADDGQGWSVWRTDGTEPGTERLVDASPPWVYTGLRSTWDQALFLGIVDSVGRELWVTQGTRTTTQKVADFDKVSFSAFASVDDVGYFGATGPGGAFGLWRSDGTVAGTYLVRALSDAVIADMVALGGSVVLSTGFHNDTLLKSDGTGAGTVLVSDELSGIRDLTVHGDRVFFVATDESVVPEVDGLYTLDASGTVDLVMPVPQAYPSGLTSTAFGLVFEAIDLWVSDGTPAGTSVLVQPVGGQTISNPIVAAGGYAYFVIFAPFGVGSPQLWSTDGSPSGTGPVEGVVPLLPKAEPIGTGPEVFLRVLFGTWRVDPQGAELFLGLGPDNGGPDPLGRAGQYYYFRLDDWIHGDELHAVPYVDTEGHVSEAHGVGCAGSSGVVPSIGSSAPPLLGTTWDVELADALPLSGAILVHSFGVMALPLLECTFYPTLPFLVTGITATDVEGEGAVTMTFPSTSALTGIPFYTQYLVADPGGAFDGVAAFSPVLEVLVGP